MRLVVALPNRIEVDRTVTKVAAEGIHGNFTLLPHHIDYVVVLASGILSYTDGGGERYVAVDGGILTKVGEEVRVSTVAAVPGDRLEMLEQIVSETFRHLDERERNARIAQARIESHVLQEMFEFEESR
ncbi:MAG: F0F1 ATP synthase subunit epsilon [Actinomycetota bacterium]